MRQRRQVPRTGAIEVISDSFEEIHVEWIWTYDWNYLILDRGGCGDYANGKGHVEL